MCIERGLKAWCVQCQCQKAHHKSVITAPFTPAKYPPHCLLFGSCGELLLLCLLRISRNSGASSDFVRYRVRGEMGLVPSYLSTGSGPTAKHLPPPPAQDTSVCSVPASEQTRFQSHCFDIWALNFCMNQYPAHCSCRTQNREQTQKS